ncbi:MAG: hypothetical protein KA146_09355 [Leptospiraceae bacterium]|nr:hypothetical protein [Leptospiraceae bacterium]
MAGKPIPTPSFLDDKESYKVINGRKVWRCLKTDRLYTWDSLHGEIEVFNKKGNHLGAIDAVSGMHIKDAVKGRSINVK